MAEDTDNENIGCGVWVIVVLLAIGYGLYRAFSPAAPAPATMAPAASLSRPSESTPLTNKRTWDVMRIKTIIPRKGHEAEFFTSTSWLPSDGHNGNGSLRYQVNVYDFTNPNKSGSEYITALAQHCDISLLLLDKDSFIVSEEHLTLSVIMDDNTNTVESLVANSSDSMLESNYRLIEDINFAWKCR